MHRNQRAGLKPAPSPVQQRPHPGPDRPGAASPNHASGAATSASTSAAKVKQRILVLDDEVDFSQLLKLSLEQTGDFEVRVANTPLEGLAAAAQFEPNLILLDVMLPDMDGGEVAARLRADPKLNRVPIIFLTAAVRRAEVSLRNGKIGGLTFLAKPVDLPELIACIKDHLQQPSAAKKPASKADPRATPRGVVKKPDGTGAGVRP